MLIAIIINLLLNVLAIWYGTTPLGQSAPGRFTAFRLFLCSSPSFSGFFMIVMSPIFSNIATIPNTWMRYPSDFLNFYLRSSAEGSAITIPSSVRVALFSSLALQYINSAATINAGVYFKTPIARKQCQLSQSF